MDCSFREPLLEDSRDATGSGIPAGDSRLMSAARSTTNSVDDIHQLERAWPEALVSADIDLLEGIWAEDFSLTTPDGTQITRDDCLAGLYGGEIQFESFEAQAHEMLVYGDDVVVSGPVRVKCPRGFPDLNAAEHYVAIYSRRSEGWQQVAAIVTRGATPNSTPARTTRETRPPDS